MGMFAAEERVKNAFRPLVRRHCQYSGYGFFRICSQAMKGFTRKAVQHMQPTSRRSSFP